MKYITNNLDLIDCLDELSSETELALDVETTFRTGLETDNEYNKIKIGDYGAFDPHTSRVRLVQLKGRNTESFVIDLDYISQEAKDSLASFLKEDRLVIGANIKFDLKHIKATLGVWCPKAWCLMQAGMMITNASGFTDRSNGLAGLSRDFLGLDIDKTQQASDWSLKVLSDEQIEYAGLDVEHIHELYDKLKAALEDDYKMKEPVELEMACLVPTAKIEYNGLPFSTDYYKKCREAAKYTIPALCQKIGNVFAEKADVSSTITYVDIHGDGSEMVMYKLPFGDKSKVGMKLLMSKTAVVLPILNKIGIDIDNVQRSTLNEWKESYPELKDLIDFYTICKAESTDYSKWVHPYTNRIYSMLQWSKASTYRAASKNINSQQVSKAKLYNPKTKETLTHRECFRVDDSGDYLLCSLDFSSQELAVIAALSGDPGFVEPIKNGEDLHAAVAMKVFNVTADKVKETHPKLGKSYRDLAKIVNFSLAYGKGPQGFAEDWKCSKQEAEKIISDYKKQYPILSAYLEEQGIKAALTGKAVLVNGAIRFVGKDKKLKDSDAYRAGMNFAVQGLSSFMTRQAVINIDNWLETNSHIDCKCVAVVHDEVVMEYKANRSCPKYKICTEEVTDEQEIEKLKQECNNNCPEDHNCIDWIENQLKAEMIKAGNKFLKGIVPSGSSASSKKYWSK